MSSQTPSKSLKFGSRLMVFAVLASMTGQAILLRPNVGQAQTASGPRGGQRSNSKVIAFLIASSREQNAQKSIEFLERAREEVKKEGLAPDDATRILSLIDDLEKKAKLRLESATPPAPLAPAKNGTKPLVAVGTTAPRGATLPVIADLNSLAGTPTPSTSSQTKEGLNTKDVENMLAANPEVRDAMWEIGRSRLSRDAQNLNEVVQDRVGKTPAQIDAEEANIFAEALKPGAFATMLDSLGLSKLDFTAENALLKRNYEGVTIDEIANHIIAEKTIYGGVAGFAKGVAQTKGFIKLGVTAEVLATFMINSRLVLQLANLYGIELNDSEKQLFLLIVFAAAKAGVQYGVNSESFTDMMKSLGRRMGELRFTGKTAAMIGALNKIVNSPKLAKWISPELTNFTRANAVPVTPAGQTAAPAAPAPAAPTSGQIRAKISAAWLWVLQVGYSTAMSASETVAMGTAAKWIFSGMRQSRLQIYNENFRRFLLTSSSEGFFKLLVLAMNDGRPSADSTANAVAAAELKTKLEFMLNIARSARVCSTDDLKKVKMDAQAAYACQANPNTARFERLRAELLTFDEIPQDYVTDLRAQPREYRIRMAELIIQMQYLDGDRNPNETQFFRMTIAKALGVDSTQDLAHFERLHAFIHDHGGLVRAPLTPTGFTIREAATRQPYNLDLGYLPPGAPEAPEGQRYLDTKSAAAAAVTPVVKQNVAPPTTAVVTVKATDAK